MPLNGLSVLVTGAAQGVGRGIALAAAAEGASVAVTARRIETAQAVVDQIVARGGRGLALGRGVGGRAGVGGAVGA